MREYVLSGPSSEESDEVDTIPCREEGAGERLCPTGGVRTRATRTPGGATVATSKAAEAGREAKSGATGTEIGTIITAIKFLGKLRWMLNKTGTRLITTISHV